MPNPGITLPGYKMYIVGAMVALLGVLKGVFGIEVPGVTIGDDWFEFILTGMGIGSLRAAIQKLINALILKK